MQSAGTKNVVFLSSIGAELPSGTGPVVGLHNFEQQLNQINGANVLYLRAAYFMENTLPQVNAIRRVGSVAGPLRADLKLPMIATRDIGKVAAEALLQKSVRGKQTRELHGPGDLTYTDVTVTIGKAIGRTDLEYVPLSGDQFRGVLVQMGMSEAFACLLVEMTDALNAGRMHPLESRTPDNATPTTYKTLVVEKFVPAYQQKAAA